MARVKVKDGICGYTTVINAVRLDGERMEVKIVSPCEMIKRIGEELKVVRWKDVFTRDMEDSVVQKANTGNVKHFGCVVPSAIIRAIEVELEMASANDIRIELEK